jgi:hypothetical protein
MRPEVQSQILPSTRSPQGWTFHLVFKNKLPQFTALMQHIMQQKSFKVAWGQLAD